MLARFFRFDERRTDLATEVRGGVTTFFVMAYIIFVNASILTLNGDRAAQESGAVPPFLGVVTATCLASALMTIAMGLYTNYPFALAPGMGLNAVVAFDLIATRKLAWPSAMGLICLEGATITILVVSGFRERVMHAVPLILKRAIGAGIGMFILFIGLVNAGFVKKGIGTPVMLGDLTRLPCALAIFGLLLTLWLLSRKVNAALLAGIAVTTVLAVIVKTIDPGLSVSSVASAADVVQFHVQPIDLSTIGKGLDLGAVHAIGLLATVLVVFSVMLSDFFDTMGTIVGLGAEAGILDENGRLEGAGRVLLVDSIAAFVGGVFGTSSVTTYIESAAGISSGARTGLASVVTGLCFLLAVLAAPIAGLVPPEATAPALVIVGFAMMGGLRAIPFEDLYDGFPALLTIVVMPFTYSITNGIGAGFISWVFLRVAGGRVKEIEPVMWLMAASFAVYFAAPLFGGA